jgi:hypothetical protein
VRGERGEQERRLPGRVEAWLVGDAGGGGSRRVGDDHDAAVAFGTPRAHHEPHGSRRLGIEVPRGRAPVDRADVVAAHVLANRVELRALPADEKRRAPVELAEPGEP